MLHSFDPSGMSHWEPHGPGTDKCLTDWIHSATPYLVQWEIGLQKFHFVVAWVPEDKAWWWEWHRYDESGMVTSDRLFQTFELCVEDAGSNGFSAFEFQPRRRGSSRISLKAV